MKLKTAIPPTYYTTPLTGNVINFIIGHKKKNICLLPKNVLNARGLENDTHNFVCVARKNAMKIFTVRTKIYVMKLGAAK